MRKTKIVCTIGPASESPEKIRDLIENGMNVARLNFSHGDYEEHATRIKNIRKIAAELNKTVGILLDLQGPEIRTKTFKDGEAVLNRDAKVSICTKDVEGTAAHFSVTYKGLINDINVGNTISLDDGLIELQVTDIDYEKEEIETVVVNSGVIKNRKGVNIPNVNVNLPSLTAKDEEDIKFGIEQKVDFIAASFVRKHTDVIKIRKLLEENNGEEVEIISKIENREGVDNFDKILEASFGIMVARGDLGVEIPPEEVPLIQKELIHKSNLAGKPVITATQMLDSMQWDPRPTRAEVSDVANAILDGTDAIMLSGETAAGDFPVESVDMMHNIAVKTESSLDHRLLLKKRSQNIDMSTTEAISQSVTHTAANLGVEAIITPTQSGHAARMISKYRPQQPIIAITFTEEVHRRLSLAWGIYPVLSEQAETTDQLVELAVEKGLSTGLFTRGDRVIITAGVPVGVSGATNLMKVHIIGNVIATGQGIGRRHAYGRAVVADNAADAIKKVEEGDILVTTSTDKDMMPAIEKASAIVTEEGGLTSHAAVVGISLEIPVVVGVTDLLRSIEDGEGITVDAVTGEIHQGHASVL